MKKIIPILFVMIFVSTQLFSQKILVKLTFTGTLNAQHVDLDSIHVKNLTNNGDTTLHWPDTTLSFVFSGVGIPEQPNSKEDFTIKLLHSGTLEQETRIGLYIPENGDVEFRYISMSGTVLGSFVQHFETGNHSFLVSGGEGIFLLSAHYLGITKTLKLAGQHVKLSGLPRFQYEGNSGITGNPKSVTSINSFPFSPGDSLMITGYIGILSSVLLDNPSQNSNYTLAFGMNFPCPGLANFTYGGQTYNTVQIGTQCWMKENLNIGTMVASIYSASPHSECADNGIIEKYCYQNQVSNCNLFGGLYDWKEIMQYGTTPGAQGICPSGWHIPSDAEWVTLVGYLGGNAVAGGLLKEVGFTTWTSPNTGATNQSGFTALGSGHRVNTGNFAFINQYAELWSSTEYNLGAAYFHFLRHNNANFDPYNYSKMTGFSVRCLLDD